jgi:hypothetical protein
MKANSLTSESVKREDPANLGSPAPLRTLLTVFVFLVATCSTDVFASNFYISTNGSDSSAGSSSLPWKTFGYAIPKLKPGDSLIVKDGNYTASIGGYVNVSCGSSAQNGTASSVITLKAENERRARLSGDGTSSPLSMRGCSYWIVQGLTVSSADNSSVSGGGDAIDIRNSSFLTFRRLLVARNNRFTNSHLLALQNSMNILVEESEFYYFHRHAILAWSVNNSEFRRNYFNSRGYTDVLGGYVSADTTRGEVGISMYPGSNNITENNISEGNSSVVDIQARDISTNNHFLGDMSLNDNYGVLLRARGATSSQMPQNTLMENFVSINPKYYGVYARGTKNTQCANCTFIGGSTGYVADIESGVPGDGNASAFATNTLSVNHPSGYGFLFVGQSSFAVDYGRVYNNGTDFSPYDGHVTNSTQQDGKLGACMVYLPSASPLKGTGKNGNDIGANVLYRYEYGSLTDKPLWDSSTGQFPCGGLVDGINDVAGSSCFDVHRRLNVNVDGCPLPADYGNSVNHSAPANLKIVR